MTRRLSLQGLIEFPAHVTVLFILIPSVRDVSLYLTNLRPYIYLQGSSQMFAPTQDPIYLAALVHPCPSEVGCFPQSIVTDRSLSSRSLPSEGRSKIDAEVMAADSEEVVHSRARRGIN